MLKIINFEDYRSHPAINYSTLAGLSFSPETLNSKTDKKSTKSMDMGSIVDILLTQPDKLDKLVYVDEHELPKDDTKLGKYIRAVYPDYLHDINERLRIYNELNSGIKNPRYTCSELDIQAKDHFIHLLHVDSLKKEGTTVLTSEEMNKCSALASTFMSHPFTSELFQKQKNVEILYQVPVVFDYKTGIEMKALLDILVINHDEKTIAIKDIKTTAHLYDFYKSVGQYRYDIQQGIYMQAAVEYNQTFFGGSYKVLPFEFVCGSFDYPGKILKYTINNPSIYQIMYDGWTGKSGRFYKSVDQLIEDMQWHYAQAQFEYHREVYENNGLINLEM